MSLRSAVTLVGLAGFVTVLFFEGLRGPSAFPAFVAVFMVLVLIAKAVLASKSATPLEPSRGFGDAGADFFGGGASLNCDSSGGDGGDCGGD